MVKSTAVSIAVSAPVVPGSFSLITILPGTTVLAGTTVTYSGILYDQNGNPLPGWTVNLLGAVQHMVTDANGAFMFSELFSVAGTYFRAIRATNTTVKTPKITITVI